MATLTYIETKLAEVAGLAAVAVTAAGVVEKLMSESEPALRQKLRVLREMNRSLGDARLATVIEWALPIQQRHLADVTDAAVHLAAKEDPVATS